MKKIKTLVLVLCLSAVCGCSSGTKTKQSDAVAADSSAKDLSAVIDELAAKQEEEANAVKQAEEEQKTEEPEETPAETNVKLAAWEGDVDIDLTEMSATMIYSEVFNMMMKPDEYDGKTVRIFGMYTSYVASEEKVYHACIVKDATQCCAQGLEFILNDSYVWPDDYPENGDEVTVTGVFEVYEEGNYKVLNLKDAVIEAHSPRQPG
jgi:outer membrane murein-binding lipoprotein Lpp